MERQFETPSSLDGRMKDDGLRNDTFTRMSRVLLRSPSAVVRRSRRRKKEPLLKSIALAVAGLAIISATAFAQQQATTVPWPGSGWTIEAEESRVERYLGRDSLLLKNGRVWLDSTVFNDGVVEFDVAMSGEQGFHGLIFRAADRQNYEEVYLRPHQGGRPDATQYQPVYNGVTGWQIYSTPRFGLPAPIALDRWVHVRAALKDRRLELSVDGVTLVFPQLLRNPVPGGVGITSSGAPARFANVTVRAGETHPPQGGEGAPPDPIPENVVRRFRISSPFAESLVTGTRPLRSADWSALRWRTLDAGVRGIANIGMLHPSMPELNTVFAAVTLRAGEATSVRARFGFSDRVVVFLNGAPFYRGDDKYRTRDYRFLGTVGLYDEVVLPLKRGDNELWFAVSEDFGGWAVTLQLPDPGAAVVVQ